MRTLRVPTRIAAIALLAALPVLAAATPATAAAGLAADDEPVLVNLRIEGANRTIYEGSIVTTGHKVTTPAGGTHLCDGTNNSANATAGGTATTVLDDAAHLDGFDFDGTFDPAADDFSITRIGPDSQSATQSWGLLDNWRFAPSGGCQTRAAEGDNILWAYDASNKAHVLRLSGPRTTRTGEPYQVTVTDGATGTPMPDTTVTATTADGSVTAAVSDADGNATFTPGRVGVTRLKADRPDSIRSNQWDVITVPSLRA
jgi:hypothetical protein